MSRRILVIEDNETNMELMTYLLHAFGMDTVAAPDGIEGLEVAERETPDLIICDIELPKLNGIEVARRLRSHPALREIPLVAVTAYAMVGDRDRILAAGFNGYISKPIEPERFLEQLKVYLPEASITAREPSATTPSPDLPAPTSGTILVIDNSSVNIDLVRSTFEPNGYRVLSAHDIETGIQIARRDRPDLIISDVHLSGEYGYDFLKRLRDDATLKDIPFFFLTSTFRRETDWATAKSLGAEMLMRPISPQDLIASVAAHIKLKSDKS